MAADQPFADRLGSARQLLESGRLTDSAQAYQAVADAAADPDSKAEALYGLGIVRLQEGRGENAASSFLASYQLRPHADAAFYLGVVNNSGGETRVATQWFATALTLAPEHRPALRELTRIAVRLGAADTVAPPPRAEQRRSEPEPGQQRGTPPPPPREGGTAAQVQQGVTRQTVPWRGKPAAMVELNFRALVPGDGRQAHVVSLQLRGHEINGSVEPGDWIEVPPGFGGGQVKRLINLTTGAVVQSKYRIFGAQ